MSDNWRSLVRRIHSNLVPGGFFKLETFLQELLGHEARFLCLWAPPRDGLARNLCGMRVTISFPLAKVNVWQVSP